MHQPTATKPSLLISLNGLLVKMESNGSSHELRSDL